jgi:hypothetical protein
MTFDAAHGSRDRPGILTPSAQGARFHRQNGFCIFVERLKTRARPTRLISAIMLAMGILAPASQPAMADQGGVSFWLPGSYGSLAAVPGQPGWSFATFNYYDKVSAQRSVDFVVGGQVVTGLQSRPELEAFNTNYVFATPVFGGQAALGMTAFFGNNPVSVFGTLTGPGGRTISGGRSDALTGFGDLYPTASLRWNQGVNNYMTYLTGDIPVGAYAPDRLANLGIGHGAIDAGGGYTYFDPKTGHEFSAVIGATYNFINTSIQYQNGIDAHLDWGASQFLSPQFQVGAVGYVYQQLTGDSGSGARLGPFMSRVTGIGPQVGFIFPVGDLQGYANLKGYREFDAHDRASGWNVWLTLSISPAPPAPPAAAKPVVANY